ncbi:MAG TPA: alpha/beta hydrolase, partial [Calditrichia bacterium]|nr:alpha/beta hydrolase [Calditrichia bacterium]
MSLVTTEIDHTHQIQLRIPEPFYNDKPLFLLAHGSGNNMDSPFMETLAKGIHGESVNVVRFNFPYAMAGKKVPDSGPTLTNAWRMAISWCKQNLKYSQLFIGGKSMGGRVATMVARDVKDLRGMIFLGYPLHAPGKYDNIRDEYFSESTAPMLFVQGTRDAFARMDLLQGAISNFRERVTLHWVEGGDHSFKVLVRQGTSYPETLDRVALLV